MSIWEKLQNVDRRWIYLLLLVALIIPTLAPVSLPLPVSSDSQAAFDFLDSLPAGSVIWMSADYGPSTRAENGAQFAAILKYAFSKNLRVIGYAMWQDGGKQTQGYFKAAAAEFGKEYGKDYVQIGWKPGGGVTVQQATRNISDAVGGTDEAGNNLADLPLMQEVTAIAPGKVAAWISISSGTPGYEAYVTFVKEQNGIPGFSGVTAVSAPGAIPYVRAGQLVGLLNGLAGAADFEKLANMPGTATKNIGVQSFGHLIIITFIVLGNIGYLLGKSK